MRKKAKSFAVEEEQYDKLFALFRENYVEISISYCVNRYIKEFLEYLKAVQSELKKDKSLTVPMPFIIETMAREPIFKKFDSESAAKTEVNELQGKYNTYIKKYPDQAAQYDVNAIDDNVPFPRVVKYLLKGIAEEIKNRGKITEERLDEIAYEVGGKGLQKMIREKSSPAFDKYDPDIKDLAKKFRKTLKKKGKKDE